MASFLNQTEAREFIHGIDDPIVAALCLGAITETFLSKAWPCADFDLLYHVKMIYALTKDKAALMRHLNGDFSDSVFVD